MTQQCSTEGCTDPVKIAYLGLCEKHYQRWRRHGGTNWQSETGVPGVYPAGKKFRACVHGVNIGTFDTIEAADAAVHGFESPDVQAAVSAGEYQVAD